MVVSFKYELVTFLVSIVLAFLAGILYDFFRVLRKYTKRTLLWDILLWVLVLFLTSSVWFFMQNGEVRWYMILGCFFAGLIYLLTLSKYVYFALCFLADKICRIFSIIFKFLLTPLAFLCKIIGVYVIRAKRRFSRKVEEKYDEKKA
ncbi:MAG: spore cortex biosynthesis protein YabQ [Clostridia bacterium]|nr:spore cortex biosynthesis protein YabQ [Clostridia bacterium]